MLEGAAVHISIIGFDDGTETEKNFDGEVIQGEINANLTVGPDLSKAKILAENSGLSLEGPSPKAPFDITPQLAASLVSTAH